MSSWSCSLSSTMRRLVIHRHQLVKGKPVRILHRLMAVEPIYCQQRGKFVAVSLCTCRTFHGVACAQAKATDLGHRKHRYPFSRAAAYGRAKNRNRPGGSPGCRWRLPFLHLQQIGNLAILGLSGKLRIARHAIKRVVVMSFRDGRLIAVALLLVSKVASRPVAALLISTALLISAIALLTSAILAAVLIGCALRRSAVAQPISIQLGHVFLNRRTRILRRLSARLLASSCFTGAGRTGGPKRLTVLPARCCQAGVCALSRDVLRACQACR